MMRSLFTLPAAALLALGIAGLADAQGTSALKGHNSNAPVDVQADRAEVQDRADRAVFVGYVHVTQEELTLDTARLTIAYTNGDNGVQMQRLDASGGVRVKSPTETATGNFGTYDLVKKIITLIGNVQLNRQQSRLNGSRLVIDMNTGRAVVDGGSPSVNGGGRVSGHFVVPPKAPKK